MSVLSAQSILRLGILSPCYTRGEIDGMTYGLGPAGYDLRLVLRTYPGDDDERRRPTYRIDPGEFILAAAAERFTMPDNVLGVVHDKSSLARRGLSVFNTVIEPGWRGYLTLELVNNGPNPLWLRQGQPIAQVVFHLLDEPTEAPYAGKYQDQAAGPQGPR